MERTRILIYSQKWPSMGGESCTVLRLRMMRKLAMCHISFSMSAKHSREKKLLFWLPLFRQSFKIVTHISFKGIVLKVAATAKTSNALMGVVYLIVILLLLGKFRDDGRLRIFFSVCLNHWGDKWDGREMKEAIHFYNSVSTVSFNYQVYLNKLLKE